MNLVGEKGQKQDKAGLLWVPADYELSSSHQASQSGADVIHMPPLMKEKRKKFLVRQQCGQRAVEITQGKMKKSHYLFLALSVPWHFSS